MWAAAETTTIIIGASIPFLRKLLWQIFRKPKSATATVTDYRKSTADHSASTRNHSASARSGNPAGKPNAFEVQTRKNDDWSDKSIFHDSDGNANGVMVSKQFTVSVHSDDSKASTPTDSRW